MAAPRNLVDFPHAPLCEAVSAAAADFGCRMAVLFGSAARGEDRVEDLDIGVLCDDRPDLVAFTNRLIRDLSVQEIDLVDLCRADPLVLMFAARDGVPLYEKSPGEFDRFCSLAVRRYADTRKFREMERQEIRDFLDATFGAQ